MYKRKKLIYAINQILKFEKCKNICCKDAPNKKCVKYFILEIATVILNSIEQDLCQSDRLQANQFTDTC